MSPIPACLTSSSSRIESVPTSKKRKKRNASRPRGVRPTAATPPAGHDAFDDDAEIIVRHAGDISPTTVVPGPGNRIGVHDAEAGVLHLPNAALWDRRLGPTASATYPLLLMAGPEFPGTWEDLVAEILEFPRHPDDSEDEQRAGLEELREHGYLVPYIDGAGASGWQLAVPDDAEDHAFDWAKAAANAADTVLVGPGPTDEHVDRVHALLTARGWSIENFGIQLPPSPDRPDRPDPQNGWTYRPSYGGAVINHFDEVTPRRLDCCFRLADWKEPEDTSELQITAAGNWNGCAEHATVEHLFPFGDGDSIDLNEIEELLDELEAQAKTCNPRALIECLFFGPCGDPEGQ
ncbi:hypothetical protein ACWDO0_34430 [Nocardia rhamnosiphila]